MNTVTWIILILSVLLMGYALLTENVKGGIISFIVGLLLFIISVELYAYESRSEKEAKMYEEDKIVVVHGAKMSFDEENKKAYVYYEDSDGYIYKVYFEN